MAATEGLRRAVKGLSEAAFRERFGAEEACRQALFEMRRREGLTCPGCSGRSFCRLKTRELLQCNRCKKQVRLTAGTVFQDTKLPLTTGFAAIYHLTQSKGGISSIELGRRLGVRQQTAWLMKHKLMRAMAAREAAKPKLEGRVEIDDAYLGGERQGGKRGRGDHGRAQAAAAAAERRQGLPQEGGGEDRQAGLRRRQQRGQRWPVLLAGSGEGWLPALPDRDGFRQEGRELDAVQVGQHHARQHQDRDRRHLPSRQPEARPTLSHQLRLPLQPALPARQHRRAARLGCCPHHTAALPGHRRGCVNWIIRESFIYMKLISFTKSGNALLL